MTCVFCREPIEIGSFIVGDRQTRSASCPNCGLRVSMTAYAWTLWNAHATAPSELSLTDRLRARRVATAARLILQQVELTEASTTDIGQGSTGAQTDGGRQSPPRRRAKR
jgi:hypothetical protein